MYIGILACGYAAAMTILTTCRKEERSMGYILAVTIIAVVSGLIYWAAGKFAPHLRDGSRIGSAVA
jgi:hypothetical protein